MTIDSPLNDARSLLELFYTSMYGENAAACLEDGLLKLKEIALYPATEEKDIKVINNLVDCLFETILAEANRLRNYEPLARREDVEHWLEIMRIPYYAGWKLSDDYLAIGKEHMRLLKIVKEWKGHISKEDRRALFEDDLSFLDDIK